jgi:hypothetical protein
VYPPNQDSSASITCSFPAGSTAGPLFLNIRVVTAGRGVSGQNLVCRWYEARISGLPRDVAVFGERGGDRLVLAGQGAGPVRGGLV